MRTGTCRLCRRPIVWCKTTTGKAMPLDPDPRAWGNVICQLDNGVLKGVVLTKGDARPPGVAYVPHFATCPIINKTSTADAVPAAEAPEPQPEQGDLFATEPKDPT